MELEDKYAVDENHLAEEEPVIHAKEQSVAGQNLQVYSTFDDNIQGSERISFVLEKLARQHNNASLTSLELHAYYLPPNDLPIASLCHLLQRGAPTMERLVICHLRLAAAHHSASMVQHLVRSIGSLTCLAELSWDPLPLCLWEHPGGVAFLLEQLVQLPVLKILGFTLNEAGRPQSNHHHSNALLQLDREIWGRDSLASSAGAKRHQQLLVTLIKRLKRFRLAKCALGPELCHILAQGLTATTTTTVGAGNEDEGQQHQRPQSLAPSMKHLDLSSCTFLGGPYGLSYVIESLERNSSLHTLELMHCQFVSADDAASSPAASCDLPRQCSNTLRQILEVNNTTLAAFRRAGGEVDDSGGSSTDSSSGGNNPQQQQPQQSSTWRRGAVDTLLLLNQSGIRKAGNRRVGHLGMWAWYLWPAASCSPTVTYQLLCQETHSLLDVAQASSGAANLHS